MGEWLKYGSLVVAITVGLIQGQVNPAPLGTNNLVGSWPQLIRRYHLHKTTQHNLA